MTRSDLLLEVVKFEEKAEVGSPTYNLVEDMHRKIENAYKIVFELEKDEHFKGLGELLRKALES